MRTGKATVAFLGIAALGMTPACVQAQSYPAKPVRFLIGFPPGGGSDAMARAVSQKLAESVGRQVIVDNRPGANANIAAELAARSAPDGYTMVLVSAPHAVSKVLYRKLGYDLEKDLAPIGLIGAVPHALIVHPSLPAKTVQQLVALARAHREPLVYASGGIGSTDHIAPELFASMTGLRVSHVPYKGGGPAVIDLAAGHVSMMIASMPAAIPVIQSKRVRCLAVTGAKRARVLPDIPTIAEAGVPGYELTTWYGAMFPSGTPREIVDRMNAELGRAVELPDVRERLASVGAEPMTVSPEEFGAIIRRDVAKFANVVKTANIRAE